MEKLFVVVAISCWTISPASASMIFPHYPGAYFPSHLSLNFSSDSTARLYTQFDFGTTRLINNGGQHLPNKMIFSRHIAVGVDFTGDRFGLYFTNFGRYKWRSENDNIKKHVILDINEFGLSYMHAFKCKLIFHPYLGIRLGYVHFKLRNTHLDTKGGYFALSENHDHISIGTFGGVETKISHNFTVGIGIEYGLLRGKDTTDLTTKVFTRFYF